MRPSAAAVSGRRRPYFPIREREHIVRSMFRIAGKLVRIADKPLEFPDGPYMVEFADQSLRTNKYHGTWELTFLAPDVEITEAA